MWLVRFLLIIIAIVAIVGFILYNSSQRVDLFFPWGNYLSVPVAFVCFWAFVLGMVVSFIYSIFYFLKVATQVRDKNRLIRKLEEELSTLRNRSVEDLEDLSSLRMD